jgi:DNA polymerase zeta
MASDQPFRFRLNCIDHYQAKPCRLDPQLPQLITSSKVPRPEDEANVPVIRVFGATETGQKVCAHIHGAFPYLYLEYDGSLQERDVKSYIGTLAASINHALALSYRRNPFQGPMTEYVAHITLVKGVPFYGYHVGYKYFLKVYMRNPGNMTRLADLLSQGAILAKVLQPHESHLQYLLQWMCDYNLYGCGYIDCKTVSFRNPIPDGEGGFNDHHRWHTKSIPSHWIASSAEFPRKSHCSIEVDICVQDILNRHEVELRDVHRDFSERFFKADPGEKYVHSMAGLWRDESIRRKKLMGIKDPGSSPFPPEALVTMSAGERREKGNWVHEEDLWTRLRQLVQLEKNLVPKERLTFEHFFDPIEEPFPIRTAFQSIEDLYPANISDSLVTGTDLDNSLEDIQSQIVVDASNIRAIDEEQEKLGDELDEVQPYDTPRKQRRPGPMDQQSEEVDGSPSKQNSPRRRRPFNDITTYDHDPLMRKKRKTIHDGSMKTQRKLTQTEEDFSVPAFPFRSPNSKQNTSGTAIATSNNGLDNASSKKTNSFPLNANSGLAQQSIKAHGKDPSTLSFPTIKNPHEPDAELRLSQRSEYSNSQKHSPLPKTAIGPGHGDENELSNTRAKISSIDVKPNQASRRLKRMASKLPSAFGVSATTSIKVFALVPPNPRNIGKLLKKHDLPNIIAQEAYYSNERDVPDKPRDYAGQEFRLQSTTLPYLPDFSKKGILAGSRGEKSLVVRDTAKEEAELKARRAKCNLKNWEIAEPPPSASMVKNWLRNRRRRKVQSITGAVKPSAMSQIAGPTQDPKHRARDNSKKPSTSVQHETQYMSMMSLEVHVNTRGNLVPDPAEDGISCIFWSIQSDSDDPDVPAYITGMLALRSSNEAASPLGKHPGVQIEYEEDELDLLNRMVTTVREHDPDILVGYEVHNGSWGYLIERARLKFEFDLCDELSRTKFESHGRFGKEADRWGFTHTSTIRITGRHMINIWRAMRSELNLLQYTMENVVWHVLHQRIPHYAFSDLTACYQSGNPRSIARVLNYFLSRVQLNLKILEANETVSRTSEQARLLGVDWFSVISRGSQFKVESLMFRIAKPENYILVSPSRKQVGQQNALECLPLVMEPQSNFYPSPLLVLDFQSLYPSVMIAYNYCYSTCLGRAVSWRNQNKMGFTDLRRETGILELLGNHVSIAPNGMVYVRPELRKSLLAKMLTEILETRVMVKSGMKQDKDDQILQRLLNNRQLALKLIANVTYGYTSASFSGRMPCAEIADSIVQTARETLEKSIAFIHSVTKWNAEVVYGDTDSLFVYLKGRSREEAFEIGRDIAKTITEMNPRPVKLKFEKVYHPCVLLAKKRYVGFKYESPDQVDPEFDAKGIETVRRDGTPAEQKIEEKALKILFRTADLSQVKSYFQDQCTKIMAGKVSIQDFLFAREVKLGTYSDRGPPPPGALIATKRMQEDSRKEPQYGERIPYVVITGAPGARLIDRCVDPEVLLKDDQVDLDAEYYIGKNIIPPLERIFNLVGANVRSWYDEMPKIQRVRTIQSLPTVVSGAIRNNAALGSIAKKTLENYLHNTVCLVCRTKLADAIQDNDPEVGVLPICDDCAASTDFALYTLRRQLHRAETRATEIDTICRSCSGISFADGVTCDSRDCPVFYTRVKDRSSLESTTRKSKLVIRAIEATDNTGVGW